MPFCRWWKRRWLVYLLNVNCFVNSFEENADCFIFASHPLAVCRFQIVWYISWSIFVPRGDKSQTWSRRRYKLMSEESELANSQFTREGVFFVLRTLSLPRVRNISLVSPTRRTNLVRCDSKRYIWYVLWNTTIEWIETWQWLCHWCFEMCSGRAFMDRFTYDSQGKRVPLEKGKWTKE